MKISYWHNLTTSEQNALLQRPSQINTDRGQQVADIIAAVRQDGDAALIEFSQRYDNCSLDSITLNSTELENATLPTALAGSIATAIQRITNYQQQCLPKNITIDSQDGVICQRIPKAIQRVGLYVPGGSAPLVSTLMMLAIPAKIAGCRTRVLCTPPNAQGNIDPLLLATAKLCGIEQIYKVGGAQAIAAMAYGSQSVPKVDKIFGPGNAWVTEAKVQVAQDPEGAALDMPAGPF